MSEETLTKEQVIQLAREAKGKYFVESDKGFQGAIAEMLIKPIFIPLFGVEVQPAQYFAAPAEYGQTPGYEYVYTMEFGYADKETNTVNVVCDSCLKDITEEEFSKQVNVARLVSLTINDGAGDEIDVTMQMLSIWAAIRLAVEDGNDALAKGIFNACYQVANENFSFERVILEPIRADLKPTKAARKPRRPKIRNTGIMLTKDKVTGVIFNSYKNKEPITPAYWVNEETIPVDNGKAKSTSMIKLSAGEVSEDEMERATSYFLPSERIWLDMINSIVNDGARAFSGADILARAGIKKPKRANREMNEAYRTVLKLWGSHIAVTVEDSKKGNYKNYLTIRPTRLLDADIPVTFATDENGEIMMDAEGNKVISNFEVVLNSVPGQDPSKALPLLEYAKAANEVISSASNRLFEFPGNTSMDRRRIANHLYRHACSSIKYNDRCDLNTIMGATGIVEWNREASTAKEKAAVRDKRRRTQRNVEAILGHWKNIGIIESWERSKSAGGSDVYIWHGFKRSEEALGRKAKN